MSHWKRVGVLFYTRTEKMLKIKLFGDKTSGLPDYFYCFVSDIKAYLRGDKTTDIPLVEFTGTLTGKIAGESESRLHNVKESDDK